MLITLLKTSLRRQPQGKTTSKRRTPGPTAGVRAGSVRAVVDLAGPLPEPTKKVEAHPYVESALVGASLRPTTYRRDATELSKLPPELDPFEADFPWIGWTEPKHRAVVASELRTQTFERDLERVLRIFEN